MKTPLLRKEQEGVVTRTDTYTYRRLFTCFIVCGSIALIFVGKSTARVELIQGSRVAPPNVGQDGQNKGGNIRRSHDAGKGLGKTLMVIEGRADREAKRRLWKQTHVTETSESAPAKYRKLPISKSNPTDIETRQQQILQNNAALLSKVHCS